MKKTEKASIAHFYSLIKEIIDTEDFRKMMSYRHHIKSNTYEHSIKVAYLCYRYHASHRSRVSLSELLRAALLHDFFLYDHHDKENGFGLSGIRHIMKHPSHAERNAQRAYVNLTDTERNAIRRHMFPLIPIPPTTRCGWLVCFYDKVASFSDLCCGSRYKELFDVCGAENA